MNFSKATTKNLARSGRPIGVDLFAGAGGLSLGFEQAGFDVAAAVELDPIHCATHEYNFPNCATICASVADVDAASIRRSANIGHASVDVVFGGAPCQGFSLIGHRVLDDPRNRLIREFVRLTVDLNANYFVFENVKGLTIGAPRRILEETIEEFQRHGYHVLLPYQVLNAAEFGVPQDRRRLFLIGAKKGLPLPSYPSAGVTPTATVWDAIGDLPDADAYEQLIQTDATRVKFGKASHYARFLRGLDVDPSDFAQPRAWSAGLLTSSMRTEHTKLSQRRFKSTKHGDVEPVSRFLKLDPDGVSNTLRAGTGSDKGAFTSPRPIHPVAPRCITVREAARLHSYPDWFRFHVTKWHGFRQVGNSVPPLLGRAVAAQLASVLKAPKKRPTAELSLGDETLLQLSPSEAAARYGVSQSVMGRRLRYVEQARENSEAVATPQ
ncbi:MAG: DNA cytosine methyltransferase [Steroidobacteraceae bacterium]